MLSKIWAKHKHREHSKSPGTIPLGPDSGAGELGGTAGSEALQVQVPKPPLQQKLTPTSPQGSQPRSLRKKNSQFGPVLCIQGSWLRGSGHIAPRKHQYFMGSSLLASNRVFNCHETIQNFQLRANRLPSTSRPEQAGLIMLKASDRAVQCAVSPNCLSAVGAVPLWALGILSP